ncbi:MAG: glycosyltransferase, partial [Bacteroidota bacterium]
MKILILTSKLGGGGAERTAAEVSRYLAQKHEVVVTIYQDLVTYDYGGKLINLGKEKPTKSSLFAKVYRLIDRVNLLRKVLKTEQPDIVLSYTNKLNIIALVAKSLGGIKSKMVVSSQNPPSSIYG